MDSALQKQVVTVKAVYSDHLLVRPVTQRCAGCQKGCLSRLFSPASELRIDHKFISGLARPLQNGDQLEISVASRQLIGLSVLVYIAPVVLMLLLSGLAEHFFSLPEGIVLMVALAGLAVGLCSVNHFLRLYGEGQNTLAYEMLQPGDNQSA